MFNVLSIIKYIMEKIPFILLPKKYQNQSFVIERRDTLNLKFILYKISQMKFITYVFIRINFITIFFNSVITI